MRRRRQRKQCRREPSVDSQSAAFCALVRFRRLRADAIGSRTAGGRQNSGLAHRRAAESAVTAATDDAQLVLAAGGRVGVVEGSYSNFKITTYEDFLFASSIVEHERLNGDGW